MPPPLAHGLPDNYLPRPRPQPLPLATANQQLHSASKPEFHRESQAAISLCDTPTSQDPDDPQDSHTHHPPDSAKYPDAQPTQHKRPTCPPLQSPEHDSPHRETHQPPPAPAPTDASVREPPLPRRPRDTPSPNTAHSSSDQPPPRPHPRRCHTLHHQLPHRLNHPPPFPSTTPLQYGSPSRLWTGTRKCCGSTLGKGVRHFLFNSFVNVARHECPPPNKMRQHLGAARRLGAATCWGLPTAAGSFQGLHPLPQP